MTLGIAAVEQTEWPPYGKQRFFFEDMVSACSDLDLEFFFFSPLDLSDVNEIKGWKFKNGQWEKCTAPLPRLIYDRTFSGIAAEKIKIREFRFFLKKNNYRVLNPVDLALLLDDKTAFHRYLSQNGFPTLEVLDIAELSNSNLFDKNPVYYIKPLSGSGGIGIFVAEKQGNNWILSNHLNDEKSLFKSQDDLANALFSKIESQNYFLQPKAAVKAFNNAPLDLRVLIQHNGKDYQITGIAVRLGQQDANVSNLQAGGTALDLSELIDWIPDQLGMQYQTLLADIHKLSFDLIARLKSDYGIFAEIGLDLLLTEKGPIIMEGNARPSRWVFNVLADRLKEHPMLTAFHQSKRMESVRMPGLFAYFLEKV